MTVDVNDDDDDNNIDDYNDDYNDNDNDNLSTQGKINELSITINFVTKSHYLFFFFINCDF